MRCLRTAEAAPDDVDDDDDDLTQYLSHVSLITLSARVIETLHTGGALGSGPANTRRHGISFVQHASHTMYVRGRWLCVAAPETCENSGRMGVVVDFLPGTGGNNNCSVLTCNT